MKSMWLRCSKVALLLVCVGFFYASFLRKEKKTAGACIASAVGLWCLRYCAFTNCSKVVPFLSYSVRLLPLSE